MTAIGSSQLDTFERSSSTTQNRKQQAPAKKIGFQPRPAVMNSAPKLSNVKVTRPMPGKVMVTAEEGYLTGSLDGCNELTVDIYQVNQEHRGRNLGQALIARAVEEVGALSLRAAMDYTNGQALRRADGDVTQTPFGKAANALGFTLADQEGHYFIWTR